MFIFLSFINIYKLIFAYILKDIPIPFPPPVLKMHGISGIKRSYSFSLSNKGSESSADLLASPASA